MKRQALGRGLDALLPQIPLTHSDLLRLDLERIQPNAFQPRLRIEADKLEELAASIQENGILQPIVVRKKGETYEIVAGERRWRAAQKAGLQNIPAIVRDVSDEKMLQLALIENIQRDNLSPIEEAHAYQLLIEEFALTQEEIARRVGRSRTSIANTLRLLRLPSFIQEKVLAGELSMGHARALISLSQKDQMHLVGLVVSRGLSVREVERRAQRLQAPPADPSAKDANLQAAERGLEERLKTQVDIHLRGQRGRIVLHFHGTAERDRLYQLLMNCPKA